MLTKIFTASSPKPDLERQKQQQQQQQHHFNSKSSANSITVSPFARNSFDSLRLPSSVLDEADTRNLLYGTSTKIQPSPLALLDANTDIRIVILTDVPFCQHTLYDTNQPSVCLPPFQELQDIVFGSSQIVYSGPLTKFHPFPFKPTVDGHKQKWMVSRVFRLEDKLRSRNIDNMPKSMSNHKKILNTRRSSSGSLDMFRRQMGVQGDSVSTYSPPPQHHLNHHPHDSHTANNPHRPQNHHCINSENNIFHRSTADYSCAIACTFIANGTDPTCLTNHWPELLAALDQLQKSVYAKLVWVLPLNFRELIFNNNYNRIVLQLNDTDLFKPEIEAFKHRLLSAARIPRVICGQDKWPELLEELKWAHYHLGSIFIAKIIAAFIKFNRELLSIDRQSMAAAALLHNSLTRTVIVGDRIPSRRIVFILSMLVEDSFQVSGSSCWKEHGGKLSNHHLFNSNSRSSLYHHLQTFPSNEHHSPRRPSFNNDRSTTEITPLTTGMRKNCSSLRQDKMGAWEIPKRSAPQVAESPSIYTMSHVVRPTFSTSYQSSSSLSSLAMASLLNSSGGSSQNFNPNSTNTNSYGHVTGFGASPNYSVTNSIISRGTASFAHTFSASSSFFQSLWTSPRTKRMNSAVSVDDFQFDVEDMERRHSAAGKTMLGLDRMVDCEHFSEVVTPQPSGSHCSEGDTVMMGAAANAAQNSRTTATLPGPCLYQSWMAPFCGLSRSNSFYSHASSTASIKTHSRQHDNMVENCIEVPELEDTVEDTYAILQDNYEDLYEDNSGPKLVSEAESYGDVPIDLTVVLPLVTGYNTEFHPDFFLQACPPSHELYSRIVEIMKEEEEEEANANGKTAVNNGRNHPCTIIANLVGGINTSAGYGFMSSGSSGHNTGSLGMTAGQPDLLILNGRKLGVTDAEVSSVEAALKSVLDSGDVNELRNLYRMRFNFYQ